MGIDGVIDPLINGDQPTVINNESPCLEIIKSEDIIPLDDDKSSDTNSSSLSSIIAEENSIGKPFIFSYLVIVSKIKIQIF